MQCKVVCVEEVTVYFIGPNLYPAGIGCGEMQNLSCICITYGR